MKRIVTLALLVLTLLTLTSCEFFSKKDIDLGAVWAKIEEKVGLPVMQTPTSAKMTEYYPSFDADTFKQALFKVAAQNIKAEEIVLLQVKDKGDLDKVFNMIYKRIEDKQSYYKNFLEDPYNMVNNYLLKNHDSYVIFAVSPDNDKIERIFMNMVAGGEYSESE